jgi:hypothetical protein
MPRVWVPRHITWLATQLVIDYAYATCPGASARRAACRAARRRLLRLHRAFGCLGTSRDSLSTSSPTPHVRVTRHVAQARRRLLRLRRASGCLGTLCGSSRHSSSTTSPTPRVWVPRHVARLIVDYSVRRDFVLRPHWLYFSHAVCRDYLSHGNTGSTSSTSHAAITSSSGRIALSIYLD